MVARKASGKVIGGLNRKCRSDGVEIMEASTILEGLKLAAERGWITVKIESDLRVVIYQINRNIPHWRLQALLVNITNLVRRIGRITWKAVPRMYGLSSQTS